MKPTDEQLQRVVDALDGKWPGDQDNDEYVTAGIAWDVIAPLVRDATLEEAARACDDQAETWADKSHEGYVAIQALRGLGRRIRALKGTP